MNDAYLNSLLGEREKIILVTRQHWILLALHILPEILLIILLPVLAILLMTLWLADPRITFSFLLLLLPIISLIRDVLIWRNRKYVVTNRRVIQIIGIFDKNVTDSSLEKVNDVKMEQSFWGRVLNYGNIEILTASELGANRFTRIGNPVAFKIAMLNAKQTLEETPTRPYQAGQDIPSLLAQLANLHAQGVLSDEEFSQKKAALLAKL